MRLGEASPGTGRRDGAGRPDAERADAERAEAGRLETTWSGEMRARTVLSDEGRADAVRREDPAWRRAVPSSPSLRRRGRRRGSFVSGRRSYSPIVPPPGGRRAIACTGKRMHVSPEAHAQPSCRIAKYSRDHLKPKRMVFWFGAGERAIALWRI